LARGPKYQTGKTKGTNHEYGLDGAQYGSKLVLCGLYHRQLYLHNRGELLTSQTYLLNIAFAGDLLKLDLEL
jgi:hypothetical protein